MSRTYADVYGGVENVDGGRLKVYYGFVIMKEMIKWIEMSTASKAAHTK